MVISFYKDVDIIATTTFRKIIDEMISKINDRIFYRNRQESQTNFQAQGVVIRMFGKIILNMRKLKFFEDMKHYLHCLLLFSLFVHLDLEMVE